jgi:hypothetical protein
MIHGTKLVHPLEIRAQSIDYVLKDGSPCLFAAEKPESFSKLESQPVVIRSNLSFRSSLMLILHFADFSIEIRQAVITQFRVLFHGHFIRDSS